MQQAIKDVSSWDIRRVWVLSIYAEQHITSGQEAWEGMHRILQVQRLVRPVGWEVGHSLQGIHGAAGHGKHAARAVEQAGAIMRYAQLVTVTVVGLTGQPFIGYSVPIGREAIVELEAGPGPACGPVPTLQLIHVSHNSSADRLADRHKPAASAA